MKRGHLPLTALRSFEVAGRHQSFTAAAEELSISQAAVSRQIRNLEDTLGRDLFVRLHRRVVLTPAGERLLAVLTRSFDDIDDALKTVRTGDMSASVKISVEPSFAGCWLVSHLATFQSEHPAVDVIMDVDPRLIDFRGDQPQVAIRHSEEMSSWPRSESRPLFDAHVIPVIAPHLAEKLPALRRPEDLLSLPLLHEDNHDLWARWFTSVGVENTALTRGPIYADGALVQQAAIQGQGIGLVDAFLAHDELAAGRLQQAFRHSVSNGRYFVVARRFDHLPAPALAFVDWLCAIFPDSERSD